MRLEDLALFGAPPAFDSPRHVGFPNIGDRPALLARINDLLDRRWLSNHGPFVQEFEARIASLLGVKHCVAVANGTLALEIAMRALDLQGEVIVPSFTFIATAHALQWQRIKPVFCDVDANHMLDPECVERLITPATTGIVGVHLWGRACNVAALSALAARHHLALMFDAAHAFACSNGGTMIGNFGDVEVFSFHATKFINTFEGGAVVTNRDDVALRIRRMSNFGFADFDRVDSVGTNGKMSEVAAAMGLTSLEGLDPLVAANRHAYHDYRRLLADIPGLTVMSYDEQERGNYQYMVVDVDESLATVSRDHLIAVLHAENVMAKRYFYPGCHRQEPYRSPETPSLPVTEALCQRILVLPTGPSLSDQDRRRITGILRLATAHGPQIAGQLAAV